MPRRYPAEFRRKVLDLVESGRPVAQVAHDLGISDQTIYNWRRQHLIDTGQVPVEVAEYLAEQLEIADPSCLKEYGERDGTARTHAGEIQKTEAWRDFAEVSTELGEWVEARAWTTGDGPKALFDASVAWMRERQVLLPGVTVLTRLVGSRRETATQRLWEALNGLLDDEQRAGLDGLLEVPQGHRHSRLDRLRRSPTRVSGSAMVEALQRATEILWDWGSLRSMLGWCRRDGCRSWPGTGCRARPVCCVGMGTRVGWRRCWPRWCTCKAVRWMTRWICWMC